MFKSIKDIYKAIIADTPPPIKSKRPIPIPKKIYVGHNEVLEEGDYKHHLKDYNEIHHTWYHPGGDRDYKICSTCGRMEKKKYLYTKEGVMR